MSKRTTRRLAEGSLRELLARNVLRRLAGERSFARGQDYANDGLVGAVLEHEGVLTAKVQGTHAYRVKLWCDGDGLGYECSCPVGRDGEFCKHAVAVALTWMDTKTDSTTDAKAASSMVATKRKGHRKSVDVMAQVRAHLERQDKPALVRLLLEQVLQDDALRRRLQLQAAGKQSGGPDVQSYLRAIEDAIRIRGFLDYSEAYAYTSDVHEVIDGIEKLLKTGHAAVTIELTEHALALIEDAIGHIDDSDGGMHELLERLQVLHHRACKRSKPDPETLARRLFEWELRSEWDVFHGAGHTYAAVLGKRGLAVYRALAEKQWRDVPVLGPGDDERERYGARFRITAMMEALARASGDIEAVVAVKQRDLSSAHAYLKIAELYLEAGRHDVAQAWAERGLQAFPVRTDPRLRELLAELYHRGKRHDDAMKLMWALFDEMPCLQRYQQLLAHARRAKQKDAWRERALTRVRGENAGRGTSTMRAYHAEQTGSLLVEIFLAEKDTETAWREAQARGCSEALWRKLAERREKTHPEEAVAVYRRFVEPWLDRTHNDAYQEAVMLLGRIRTLMQALRREADFSEYLATLRLEYKRKRNFIKLLDQQSW